MVAERGRDGYVVSPEAEASLEEMGGSIAQDNPHRSLRSSMKIGHIPLVYIARPESGPASATSFYVTDKAV